MNKSCRTIPSNERLPWQPSKQPGSWPSVWCGQHRRHGFFYDVKSAEAIRRSNTGNAGSKSTRTAQPDNERPSSHRVASMVILPAATTDTLGAARTHVFRICQVRHIKKTRSIFGMLRVHFSPRAFLFYLRSLRLVKAKAMIPSPSRPTVAGSGTGGGGGVSLLYPRMKKSSKPSLNF